VKNYCAFRKADGALIPGVVTMNQAPKEDDSVGWVEGNHDHLSKRVELATKTVVEYQPPAPSQDHEWNATTKRWQPSAVARAKAASRAEDIAKIAALEASQHTLLRKHALGDVAALPRLQAIDDEIAAAEQRLLES
jgi:hypothetical protein